MPGLGVFRLELTPFFEGEMTYIWGVTYSLNRLMNYTGGINFGLVQTLTGAQPPGTQNAGPCRISCDALTFEQNHFLKKQNQGRFPSPEKSRCRSSLMAMRISKIF